MAAWFSKALSLSKILWIAISWSYLKNLTPKGGGGGKGGGQITDERFITFKYTIVYNLYTKGFMAYDSTKPLAPHLKPVVSGEVPYSVLQTFKPQIDERDMGSHGTFKKQNKIRNRTIQI